MKTRQRLRKAMILVYFISLPATLYYLSPVVIMEGGSQGIVTGSFIAFAAMFALSIIFGRLFCGWACPGAGLQEACFSFQDKRFKGGKRDWIKYFIWVPWVTAIAALFFKAGGIKSIQPFYQMKGGFSVTDTISYIVYFSVVTLIVLPAVIAGRRGFCHTICWMAPFMVIGTRIGRTLCLPMLRLKSDTQKCGDCKTCTKSCPMSLDVNAMVQSGRMADSECILCGTCADNCPRNAICYSFSSYK